MELTKTELLSIEGGAITSSLINAVTKAATSLYNFGRSFGTIIRRLGSNTTCPIS